MKQALTALITGGSSGIGWAMARQLAQKGCNVVLVSNQAKELEACRTLLQQEYRVRCETLCIDLSQTDAAQQVYNYCAALQLQVNVLVNNAGMLVFSEVAECDPVRMRTILQLHMNTPTQLCNLFGSAMKNNSFGYILNVSSISAVMPYPGISLYGPSKTYMRYFSRALRTEMKLYGVKVCCVLPGATATALYDPNRVNISLAKRLGVMNSPEFVAQKAVNALFANKAECIPGAVNYLTVKLLPLLPQWFIYLLHKHTGLVSRGRQSLG